MIIYANLDCEWHMAAASARHEGRSIRPLPTRVLRLISRYGTLLRVFAEPGDELWTPVPVPSGCLRMLPELETPVLRSGHPPEAASVRIAWADAGPAAVRVNRRDFALEIGRSLGTAPPAAVWVSELDTVRRHLPDEGAWILKAPWSAAGRDRVRGVGRALPPALQARMEAFLENHGGGLLEPWVERTADFGYGPTGAAHTLEVDGGGRFRGIVIPAAPLSTPESTAVSRVQERVAIALAAAGYLGPCGVDAWRYREGTDGESFQPLGELNARLTFGLVARALLERVATPRWGAGCSMALRFGERPEQSDDVTIPLLGDAAGEAMHAWLKRLRA